MKVITQGMDVVEIIAAWREIAQNPKHPTDLPTLLAASLLHADLMREVEWQIVEDAGQWIPISHNDDPRLLDVLCEELSVSVQQVLKWALGVEQLDPVQRARLALLAGDYLQESVEAITCLRQKS